METCKALIQQLFIKQFNKQLKKFIMKKLLFLLLVFITSITSYAQINFDEEKLSLAANDMKKLAFEKGNVDCKCSKNILNDGGFQNLSVTGSGSVPSNISSISVPWKPGTKTPQWSNTIQPACDKGVVSMWGNKTIGESIFQDGLTIAPGCYKVKFTARFINPTALSTFVRLKFATVLSSGTPSYDPPGVASVNISSTSWETYSFTFTTGAANIVNLHPENDYTQNNGDYVSWIQLDNICIEKCCDIPVEKCNPSFTISPFTLNAQCQLIINTIPSITSGVQHYWGAVYATGISDNTPIPITSITSGGTWGLSVSSTGVVTQLGMGTGVNGGTTGYGYNYLGFPLGKCFKITHYIKCCDKWYSQTNTYCPKICNEVKEGSINELNDKEIEKAEAAIASQGRG